jgi:alpha-tubulin suppressor-like RCC1 family protein
MLLLIFIGSYTDIIMPNFSRTYIPHFPVINYSKSGKSIPNLEKISNITLGEDHTFVIDENNNLMGFGNNEKGQLGLNHTWEVEKPTLVPELKGRTKIVKTSGDLNIAVTTDNEFYIWPFEYMNKQYKPLRLYLDKKIIIQSVSCGKNFAIILSKQGILYSFGKSNKTGELGLGDNNPRITPEPIEILSFNGEKITQVTCGFKHVVARSSIGKVFTWGCVRKIFF